MLATIHPQAVLEKAFFLISDYYKASKDGVKFRVHNDDYQLRAALRSDWEKVFKNLLQLCHEKTLFVDVGANIGIATLLLARKAVKVISIEPVPSTFLRLTANISESKLYNIHPFCCASSGACGIVTMTATPSSGINRIINPSTKAGAEAAAREGSEKVVSLRLDNLLEGIADNSLFNHLLVKVDTERHELETLKGAMKTLSAATKITVCAEYYSGDNLREINSTLNEINFHPIIPPYGNDESNAFFSNFHD